MMEFMPEVLTGLVISVIMVYLNPLLKLLARTVLEPLRKRYFMPSLEKQRIPFKNHRKVAITQGRLLDRVILLEDLPETTINILIYGQNRTGKTTLACSFPKPMLMVSFEPDAAGGTESVKKIPGISYIKVVPDNSPFLRKRKVKDAVITLDEAVMLARELEEDMGPYKWLIFDGATSCQDVVLANLLNLPAIPDQLSWGTTRDGQYVERAEKTREVIRPFLDLPIDTIILAKEKDHNPPKQEKVSKKGKVMPDMRPRFLRGTHEESYIAAELGGTTTGWLQDACSCTCRLFVDEEVEVRTIKAAGQTRTRTEPTGRYIRYLRTSYHPNYSAGVRSATPEEVPEVMIEPTPEKILKMLGR